MGFFLPTGGGCTCSDVNSGRRKRQAQNENSPNTKFFGGLGNLLGGGTPHCGSCCYGSNNFGSSNNNNNFGSSNNFGSQSQCQCDYLRPSKTSTVTPTEPAGGRITPGRLGATPRDGTTRAVETFRAPPGSLTTPGPTGPAATRGSDALRA